MFLKYPRIFTLSLRKIKFMVGFLRFELGFDAGSTKLILHHSPNVLGLDAQNNLKVKMDFLRDELNLSDIELKKIIKGLPTIFQISVSSNLLPKLNYLKQVFNEDEVKLKQAIITLPALLGYSLENRIKPRIQAILDIGEDVSRITSAITFAEKKFQEWIESRSIMVNYERRVKEEQRQKTIDEEDNRRSAKIVKWKR